MYHGAVQSTPTSVTYLQRSLTMKRHYGGLLVWATAAVLAYRFYWIVSRYAVNLFFFDEWDVYDGLFRGWPWWQIFLQEHGPHRQGLGVTLVSWLLQARRWDSRWQAYVIAAALVLATILAIRLKQRTFGALQLFDVVIPVMFLGVGQWEVLLSAPGPSAQAFPLLLLMAYCLAWLQQRYWLRYSSVTMLNFLLIFTGYGIFATVLNLALLGLECWRERRSRQRLVGPVLALAASAASLAAFFHGYVFAPAVSCYEFPYRDPAAYPLFMALMFAKYLGLKHGMVVPAVLGLVTLLLLLCVLAASSVQLLSTRTPDSRVTVILTGYTFLYASAAAVGRVCLGMEAAGASRNLTLLIPGFLGLYFYLLSRGHGYKRNLMMVALLVAILPSCIQRNHKEIEGFSAMKRAWKSCYLAHENIEYCDGFSHLHQLYRPSDSNRLRKKLDFLQRNRLNLYANSD
jgi:hypothetical protein